MSKEIYAIWASRKADDEVRFGIDACDEDERKAFTAEPPTFKERQLFETDDTQSMCVVSDSIARGLMDYLWRIGIRPTGITDQGEVVKGKRDE